MQSQSRSKIFTYFLSFVFVFSLLLFGGPAAEAADLSAHPGNVGDIISLAVTGTASGEVWGTDIYTDDSEIGKAAVHAGIVRIGETKTVRLMIMAGQNEYYGSSRNGITTNAYGEWGRSFKFLDSGNQTSTQVQPDSHQGVSGINLIDYRNRVGQTVSLTVKGAIGGTVWGTDIYTDDSDLGAAAVHAGVVRIGETKTVRVMILAGQNSYRGSSRNGVTTEDWDEWDGSFKFVDSTAQAGTVTPPTGTQFNNPWSQHKPGSEAFASGAMMSWNTVPGLGYRLFRSTSDSELGISVTDFYITTPIYADVNVEPNTTYYYKIKPVLSEAQPLQGKEEVLGDVIAAYTVTTGADVAAQGKKMNFLILQLDNPYMSVNGVSREIDPGRGTTPIVLSGRSMVPIRAIVEALGGTVAYDDSAKMITLNARGNAVTMWMGKNDVSVNGQKRKMDVTPVAQNGRTYVPVRFAAENLNTKVDWINSTKEAVIVYD